MLVCCEGKVTEPSYFRGLKREEQNHLLEIEVYAKGEVPKTLVERAVTQRRDAEQQARRDKNAYLKYDEVWCVFDVDDHPRLHEAKQQAHDNGISLAISNPCFELWILLHFQDQTAHLVREEAKRVCLNHLPGYHKEVPYDNLRASAQIAVTRSKELDRRRDEAEDPGGNPSTGVYRLTERIRELGRAEFQKRLLTNSQPQ